MRRVGDFKHIDKTILKYILSFEWLVPNVFFIVKSCSGRLYASDMTFCLLPKQKTLRPLKHRDCALEAGLAADEMLLN